ncbi:MAG TPA: hypothetical protein VKZ58_08665 [Longimicrobiales bacterium]|nr:hypothetical protein [Longimicrobiales bacterium]
MAASRFDLGRYVPVRDRIRAFYKEFPTGSIRTEPVRLEDGLVLFKASVYRDPHDPAPTTGWAHERVGADAAEFGRFFERCETAAVGRALANRNLAGGRRPSREEMEKVVQRRTTPSEPVGRIRALLAVAPLPVARRRRIEEKLRSGLTGQAAHELEAYLLALTAPKRARK